jgi:hypothetical protein
MSRWREVWRQAVARVAEHATRTRDAVGVLAIDFIHTFEPPEETRLEAAAAAAGTTTTATAPETARSRQLEHAAGGSVVRQDSDVPGDGTHSTSNSAAGSSSEVMSHDDAATERETVTIAMDAASAPNFEDDTHRRRDAATTTATTTTVHAPDTGAAWGMSGFGNAIEQEQRGGIPQAEEQAYRSASDDMPMLHSTAATTPPPWTMVGTGDNDSQAPSGDGDSIATLDPNVLRRTRPEYRDFLQHLARVLVSAMPGQPVGADDELISRFSVFTVREGVVVAGEEDCPICLDALSGMLMMLPCMCVGHVECMTSALRADVRCPLHRIDVRVHVCSRSSPNGGPSPAEGSSSSLQQEEDDLMFSHDAVQEHNTFSNIVVSVSTRAAPSHIASNSHAITRSRSDLGLRDSIQELDTGRDNETRTRNRERMESRLERFLDNISIQTVRLIRDLGQVLFDSETVSLDRQAIRITPESVYQGAHQISRSASLEGLQHWDGDEAQS